MRETWDGQQITAEAPFGAAVVVYRKTTLGFETLILHRAHNGPLYEGDWAWTPPSGARQPGETIDECAARELYEEAGLTACLRRVSDATADWVVYLAYVEADVRVHLHDSEHDRFEWVTFEEAVRRCRPDNVAQGLLQAAAVIAGTENSCGGQGSAGFS